MLDYLFLVGDVAIAGRNTPVRGLYDLPERVLPAAVLDAPDPDRRRRPTASWSAGRPGRTASRRAALPRRLLPDALQPGPGSRAPRSRSTSWSRPASWCRSTVEGWKRPAYLHRDARLPRRVGARALLSPFDPVVWERERTEALFDFHYRIEIYVPAPQRVHGYYVLPFLLGDRIVARVDLKADRAAGGCSSRARTPRRARRRRPPRSWRPSCAGWPAGSGLDDVVVGAAATWPRRWPPMRPAGRRG